MWDDADDSEVHLANWFFDGARADVAKVVSANPAFQLTHAFALGSASKPASYNFGAIFANAQVSSRLVDSIWTKAHDRHSSRVVSMGRGS
jgi:hypothetical protein